MREITIRSLVIVLAVGTAFALAGCGDMMFRPPNTSVFSPGEPHGITETPPPSGTIRQCPPSALDCY